MRGDRAFIDTNVFVYLCTQNTEKAKRAIGAMDGVECVANVQVVMEFCSVCTRKLHFSADKTRRLIRSLIGSRCEVCAVDGATVDKALGIHERYGYSFYDSVMIASALESGCGFLFSEDMRSGQTIQGTTIVDIFAER